jgi:hypothetical protein
MPSFSGSTKPVELPCSTGFFLYEKFFMDSIHYTGRSHAVTDPRHPQDLLDKFIMDDKTDASTNVHG